MMSCMNCVNVKAVLVWLVVVAIVVAILMSFRAAPIGKCGAAGVECGDGPRNGIARCAVRYHCTGRSSVAAHIGRPAGCDRRRILVGGGMARAVSEGAE